MNDKHGTPVFPRDLMASFDGGSYSSEGNFTHINLWEVPDSCDGSGIWYTSEGEPTYFWWGHVQKSTKLYKAKLPDGFYQAFRHGMHSIYADEKLCEKDIYEALKQSNWQGTLTPEETKRMHSAEELDLTCFHDVYKNQDLLMNCTLSEKVLETLWKISLCTEPVVHNGEIGIAQMQKLNFLERLVMTMEYYYENDDLESYCLQLDTMCAEELRRRAKNNTI